MDLRPDENAKPTLAQLIRALLVFMATALFSVALASGLFWLSVDAIAEIDISLREAIGGGMLLSVMSRTNNS